jgi:hypothetical protein
MIYSYGSYYGSDFRTVSPLGVFTAGPFTAPYRAGVYTVTVTSITVTGDGTLTYTPTGTNSFVLTVIDPCLSAVITSTTVADATLYVYSSTYSAFTLFTYTSSLGSTACGTIQYSATDTPPSGASLLTSFSLSTYWKEFYLYTNNLNQVGVHTGKLFGTLPWPCGSVQTSATFSITVVDPCPPATIIGNPCPAITVSVGSTGIT